LPNIISLLQNNTRSSSPTPTSGKGSGHWSWLGLGALLVVTTFAYFSTLTAPPHLDERFLLGWLNALANQEAAPAFAGFLNWSGPDPRDAWTFLTPLSLSVIYQLFHDSLLWHRLVALLVHLLASILTFVVARRLLIDARVGSTESVQAHRANEIAMAAALLFAAYPLHPEAIAWLPGLASALSTVCFLACFYFYLRASAESAATAEATRIPWRSLAASVLFFLLALLSTGSMWIGGLLLLAYELIDCGFRSRPDLGLPIGRRLALLSPFLLLAAGSLGLAARFHQSVAPFAQSFSLSSLEHILQVMVLPINQAIWHGYAREYRFLYFLFAPLALVLPLALWRDRDLRRVCLVGFIWSLASVLPFVGTAVSEPGLYGSRWLYLASVPLSILIAAALFSVSSLTRHFRRLTRLAAIVMCLLLLIFYCRHCSNQTAAYKVGGKVLAAIEKSATIVHSKEQAPFLLVRDIPTFVSVLPWFKSYEIICLDGATGLLRAAPVPAGRLKDGLREGHFLNTALRWDTDFQSLVSFDLTPRQNLFGSKLSGFEIVQKLRPALQFYRWVSYDEKEKCLLLESNSVNGPAVSFNGEGLSPIAGDFFYLDARIEAPGQPQQPRIQLYWLTRSCLDYNNHDRHVSTPATVNDGQFHRYFLPLRTSGWIANGAPLTLTLGFPSGAKVSLREMGVVGGDDRIPRLGVLSGAAPDKGAACFDRRYYNFPNEPELGLVRLSRSSGEGDLSYSFGNVPEAASGLLEISKPDCQLENQNGSEPSTNHLKMIPLPAVNGAYHLRLPELAGPGLYEMRIIACDKEGHIAGNFSDSLQCLVTQ